MPAIVHPRMGDLDSLDASHYLNAQAKAPICYERARNEDAVKREMFRQQLCRMNPCCRQR